MADYAILQEIDKCMKCRGCQVACQRVQGLTQTVGDASKVQPDDPMVIKNQGSNDNPPFVRYSCWHCFNPPCVSTCPLGAMKIDSATGAVYVDHTATDGTKCNPNDARCVSAGRPCAKNCWKGGYPKIGTNAPGTFAYKCHLCYNNPGGPECVKTCPAKALKYDTLANIKAILSATGKDGYGNPGDSWIGTGHVFWARKSPGGGVVATFTPPTTDPFIEDHISPMIEKVLRSPVGPALGIPALLLGGFYALYRRKETLAEEKQP